MTALYQVLADVGLRLSEAASLVWNDVDRWVGTFDGTPVKDKHQAVDCLSDPTMEQFTKHVERSLGFCTEPDSAERSAHYSRDELYEEVCKVLAPITADLVPGNGQPSVAGR